MKWDRHEKRMLVIRAVDTSTTLDLFTESPAFNDRTPGHFKAFHKRQGRPSNFCCWARNEP